MTLSLVFKATTVLVAALILSRLERTSASLRHLLLCCGFAALVLLPTAMSVLPTFTYRVPVHRIASEIAAPLNIELVPIPASTERGAGSPIAAEPYRFNIWITFWIAMSLVCLFPLLASWFQTHRLVLTGVPWLEGQDLAERLRVGIGLRRSVLVLRHEAVSGPVTFGVRQPVIVFPSDITRWNGVALEAALRHEFEHIRRFDWLLSSLARGVCAVYWFHPLVWTAWRRLRLEAEQACDDAALKATNARDYAALLIRVAERSLNPQSFEWSAMAARGDLALRVRQVLRSDAARTPLNSSTIVLFASAAFLASIALGPLTIAASEVQSTPDSNQLRFDAASIKANRSGATSTSTDSRPGGQFVMTNGTIRNLLLNAYGPQSTDIVGAPDWVNTERFDVTATANATTTSDQMRSMLRSLLVDRFSLVARLEPREQPVFFLMLARADGRVGPQLELTLRDCAAVAAADRAGLPAPTLTPPKNGAPPCGMRAAGGEVLGGGISMDLLARNLGVRAGRIVIDRTGLQGLFDLKLSYSRDPNPDSDSPSLFTALQEQLGLKLEPGRSPLTTLIVERIERPTEN